MRTRTAVSPAVAVVLGGAGVLHLLADVVASWWLVLGTGALLVLPVVAALQRPRLDAVQVGRRMPPRVPVGAPVATTLVVRAGARPSPELLVTDVVPGLSDVRVLVPPLPAGGAVEVPVLRTAQRRTRTSGGILRLEALAPFGLLRAVREVPLEGVLHVHPAPSTAPPLPAGAASVEDAPAPTGRAGAGSEVLQLREWRAGDPARAVSARHTARRGTPVVLEREQDGGAELVLLLAGRGAGAAWEAALARACAAAVEAVTEGRPTALLSACTPLRGRPGPRDVLDWFAAADDAGPLDDAVVARAVRRAAHGGSLLALVPADAVDDRLRLRRAADAARVPLVVLGG